MCFALFYGDFFMDLYSVDSNEAIKQGNEALSASSLQFLSSIKCFIATIFVLALNTSSLLLFTEKPCVTLHRHYFLKEIHHLKVVSSEN
jgi:hypothetical protein